MSAISVIIPTFNRAYCLERTLRSVLKQSYPVTEILVVDDGSTDKTEQLLKKYSKVICYIKQQNQGVSHARNTGIRQAQSDWLAFLDSDDTWQTDKIAKQLLQLSNSGLLINHTDEKWLLNQRHVNQKNKHKKRGGWIFENCLPLCCISPSSVIINKKVFQKVGLFDETLPACEDYDLWLRITAHFEVDFTDLPLTIKHGGHADQLSKQYWGMDRFRIQALKKILDGAALGEDQRLAAANMLIKKAALYLNGAKKRGKTDEVAYYSQLITQYSSLTKRKPPSICQSHEQ